MTIQQAIRILELHNKWRRGDGRIKQIDPKRLGIAIDLLTSTMTNWINNSTYTIKGER